MKNEALLKGKAQQYSKCQKHAPTFFSPMLSLSIIPFPMFSYTTGLPVLHVLLLFAHRKIHDWMSRMAQARGARNDPSFQFCVRPKCFISSWSSLPQELTQLKSSSFWCTMEVLANRMSHLPFRIPANVPAISRSTRPSTLNSLREIIGINTGAWPLSLASEPISRIH